MMKHKLQPSGIELFSDVKYWLSSSKTFQLLWIISFIFLLILAFFAFFVNFWIYLEISNHYVYEKPGVGSVFITVTRPHHFGIGEPNPVQITVLNETDETLDLMVTVAYLGDATALTGEDRYHASHFPHLIPHERATNYISIEFPRCNYFGNYGTAKCVEDEIQLHLYLSCGKNNFCNGQYEFTPMSAKVLRFPANPYFIGNMLLGLLIGFSIWSAKETWAWIKEKEKQRVGLHEKSSTS